MRGREGVLQPRPGRADTTYGTRARCRCPSALETSRMSSPTAPATVVFCHRLADSTTPEQLAAWQTDFEPDGHVALVARPQLCPTLTGLGGFTQWRYRVSYEDIFGRRASARGGYLRVPSRSAVPQPTVLPLGTGQFSTAAASMAWTSQASRWRCWVHSIATALR